MPSIACQRCHQSLALPASTSDDAGGLAQSAYTLIANAATASPLSSSGALSAPLARTAALRALLEEPKAQLRHPLCKECTDGLLRIMAEDVELLRNERDALLQWENEIVKSESDAKHVDEMKEEIQLLTARAEEATTELRSAEADRLVVEAELKALDTQERALEEEETAFWQEHSQLSLSLASLSTQRSSLRTSLAHDTAQLARLSQTNVYNDVFTIGHDGGFATINGLRLGRLPGAGRATEWVEINAAWGQTCLLLDTLARKCGVTFEDYRLVPKGSFSTIEKLTGDGATFELYGSGEWQIGRLLHSRRFDHGMVAFLECLRQLAAWACARDSELRLPHAINKDRIGEASIRLQFGSDETWTRALRHVLLTLKVLLSWACRRSEAD